MPSAVKARIGLVIVIIYLEPKLDSYALYLRLDHPIRVKVFLNSMCFAGCQCSEEPGFFFLSEAAEMVEI